MKKIVLTGYMGSGKTTVATLLAKATALQCIDLDRYIEENEKKTIAEIFDDKGEIYFRKKEHEALKQLLGQERGLVLATGGGTPCYAGNHELLKGDGVITVYLKTSIGELHRRLLEQGMAHRPLLAGLPPDEQKEYIAKHLFDRSYFYMQAHHIVDTDGKEAGQVVDEIMSLF